MRAGAASRGADGPMPQLSELAEALAAARPPLDEPAQDFLVLRLRELSRGEPLPPEPRDATLPASRILRDEQGRITGLWGLSVEPTSHALEFGGRTLYTWCAWDALFLPELLGGPAIVRSRCHTTGAPVRVTVHPDALGPADPTTTVLSMVPLVRDLDLHVTDAFCGRVHFFASSEAARPWMEQSDD